MKFCLKNFDFFYVALIELKKQKKNSGNQILITQLFTELYSIFYFVLYEVLYLVIKF